MNMLTPEAFRLALCGALHEVDEKVEDYHDRLMTELVRNRFEGILVSFDVKLHAIDVSASRLQGVVTNANWDEGESVLVEFIDPRNGQKREEPMHILSQNVRPV